jgi:hypothetical protein
VINDGVSGERTTRGRWRLLDYSFGEYRPEFIELMEGTNDISAAKPYDEIAENLNEMVKWPKKSGSKPLLGTLIPRKDDKNRATDIMNDYIAEVAATRGVPLVDNWQAYYDYGPWRTLLRDALHPSTQGMIVLTDSWYDALLDNWLVEDTTPPTAEITSLPAQSECLNVQVGWSGEDPSPGTGVKNYDVQVRVPSQTGTWSNWLLETEATSGTYVGGWHNQKMGFHVRARDQLDNLGEYSDERETTIVDSQPPYEAGMGTLPPARKAPFEIYWWGSDACSSVTYNVEYRVGSSSWMPLLTGTSTTHMTFDPASPQYGETHYFRVHVVDAVGHSRTSQEVSTKLAQFTVSGQVLNVRREPVALATVVVTDSLYVEDMPYGQHVAYLGSAGDYDLSASRYGFGEMAPMYAVSVTADVSGLQLVLPPVDDVVIDAGFEAGVWGQWQPGGSPSPALVTDAHTGHGVARLGGLGGTSFLSQTLDVPGDLTDATLSLMVSLEHGADISSTLEIELEGTPIITTHEVLAGSWRHVWLPADAAAGQVVTLTLSVADDAAVLVDEVSLGSAAHGGSWSFLPIVSRSAVP